MTGFQELHPLLRHHIVNSLGFHELRPLQLATIEPVIQGQDAILLAPTAGGKTEAALFPVLSQILTERRRGLCLLYVCPLKALLNNLEQRISGYARLLGLRAGLWHGDIKTWQRYKLSEDPPEILLTTPESLEVMLVSQRVNHRELFSNVMTVIVDEVHAFAGDDRGWHLLSVLSRIAAHAPTPPQRLGLSATVGNPRELLNWLAGDSTRERSVIDPGGKGPKSHVELDYVGSLENAATIISKLYRGEKRLVFCDSRVRTEALALALQDKGVNTFVSHGSLGKEARDRAETAFSQERDCVIVATSTLELGIDVGDLDRVIQIDAPHGVASFLQRIGRTGRRTGSLRNCLFLATTEAGLLQAASLLLLWSEGYIESIDAPPLPYHILAQQFMALALQEGAFEASAWRQHFKGMPVFTELPQPKVTALLQFMKQQQLLFTEAGMLSMGDGGQQTFGRRNFMELFSVFTSPPLFKVMHGREELGTVHEQTFKTDTEEPAVLILGGRLWKTVGIDWKRKVARVQPGEIAGNARWSGSGAAMSSDMAESAARILAGKDPPVQLTQRAIQAMARLRDAYQNAALGKLTGDPSSESIWWTFAGGLYNQAVRSMFKEQTVRSDNFSVTFKNGGSQTITIIGELLKGPAPSPPINKQMVKALKFSECLPPELLDQLLAARFNLTETHQKLKPPAKNKT